LIGVHFDPEDRSNTILESVGEFLPDYSVSSPQR
jgi:hypothetical protein